MPDRERKGVPEYSSSVLKGSLPQGPPASVRLQAEPVLVQFSCSRSICSTGVFCDDASTVAVKALVSQWRRAERVLALESQS